MRRSRSRTARRNRRVPGRSDVERFYTQHEKLIQVLVAAFIAGGVVSSMYVTRDAAQQTTAVLTAKIDALAQIQAERQAVTDYRLDQVETAVASIDSERH